MRSLRRPNGADLRLIAWSAVGGDPTDIFGHRHGCNPARKDEYGVSKVDVHLAALGDERFFAAIASNLYWGNTRNQWYRDQRVTIRQPSGKLRDLDIPPEGKRLMAIHFRNELSQLVDRGNGLLPTIIGFRSFGELFGQEKHAAGLTAQDVLAATVLGLLRDVGPYAVAVDLKDAFNLLPHKAIHEALRGHGVCQQDRDLIIDLTRINTRCKLKGIIQTRHRGISQGGPLSPLVFNLVLDMIFRRTYPSSKIQAAGFGDDLFLIALTKAQSEADFDRFSQVTRELGFTNVRPLSGTDLKASKIYDTDRDPVPALKTFLISRSAIRLTPACKTPFKSQLKADDSVSSLRRKCRYKTVSKAYFLEILGSLQEKSSQPKRAGMSEENGSLLNHSLPISDEVVL